MRKFAVIIFVAIAAVYFGCSKSPQQSAKDNPLMITFLMGDVKKNGASAATGEIISVNDSIATGIDSVCDLKVGSSLVRVKEKSIVSVAKFLKSGDVEDAKVSLEVGKMLCKPKKLLKSDSFTVSTPTAVAGVRGTSFTVEAGANKTTSIMVLDGKVQVAKRLKQFEGNDEKILAVSPTLEKNQKLEITKKDVDKTEKLVEVAMDKLNAQGKDVSVKEKDAVLSSVLVQVQDDIIIQPKKIEKFSVQDTTEAKKDAEEIIQIKDAPKDMGMDKSTMSSDDIAKEIEQQKKDEALKIQQKKDEDKIAAEKKREEDRIANAAAAKALQEKIERDRKIEIGKQNADNIGKLVITNDKVIYILKGKINWEGPLVQKPIHHEGKLYVASGEYVFCALNNNTLLWKVKLENNGKLEIKNNILNVNTSGGFKTIDLKSGKNI
jgi:hypothetical protein